MTEEEQEALKLQNQRDFFNLKSKAINLGLDLQGGMHVVLEVDIKELIKDLIDEIEEDASRGRDEIIKIIEALEEKGVKRPAELERIYRYQPQTGESMKWDIIEAITSKKVRDQFVETFEPWALDKKKWAELVKAIDESIRDYGWANLATELGKIVGQPKEFEKRDYLKALSMFFGIGAVRGRTEALHLLVPPERLKPEFDIEALEKAFPEKEIAQLIYGMTGIKEGVEVLKRMLPDALKDQADDILRRTEELQEEVQARKPETPHEG